MRAVDWIPSNWLDCSAWAMGGGGRLVAYSRPLNLESRQIARSQAAQALQSLQPRQESVCAN